MSVTRQCDYSGCSEPARFTVAVTSHRDGIGERRGVTGELDLCSRHLDRPIDVPAWGMPRFWRPRGYYDARSLMARLRGPVQGPPHRIYLGAEGPRSRYGTGITEESQLASSCWCHVYVGEGHRPGCPNEAASGPVQSPEGRS